ncbi:MAG: hypothetical protein KDD66_02155 [Bdellovibrionales bacterium]|nr:hypothetical protein [Bdellovibrionales bacterium]
MIRGELPLSETAEELFVYGYQLDESGAHDHAEMIYRDVVNALEEVYQQRGEHVRADELANCAFVHGKNLYTLGRKRQARASFRHAVDKLESSLTNGVTSEIIRLYATSLRWLALAQFQTGDRKKGEQTFKKSIAVYRGLMMFGKDGAQREEAKRALRSIARIYTKLGIKHPEQPYQAPKQRLQ